MKNIVWVAALLFFVGMAGPAGAEPALELDPAQVRIGAFYNGQRVTVKGTVPDGSEVAVHLEGNRHDFTLKKKGRVFGILWMNLDDVVFRGTPVLYQVYTSKGLERWIRGNPALGDRLGVTIRAFGKKVEVIPARDKDMLVGELFKLKASQGLYSFHPGEIRLGAPENGTRGFEVSLDIPSAVAPGVYRVEALAVKGGAVTPAGAVDLEVVQVGLPKRLSNLAFQHGLLYGVLAALIAVLAGLGMGYLFKGEGGSH